jgi:nucleotidyltransferase substrate binding protein (TIGR01987 family)
MALDLSPLENSLAQLDSHVALTEGADAKADPKVHFAFRTAAIKSFEYTYETAVKMLRRELETMQDYAAEVDQMQFRTLIRVGAEKGLIADPQSWFGFRESRNITSHIYDESKAAKIYSAVPGFARAARDLLERLKRAEAR